MMIPPELAIYMVDKACLRWELDGDGARHELGRGATGSVYAGVLHTCPVAIKVEGMTVDRVPRWAAAAV